MNKNVLTNFIWKIIFKLSDLVEALESRKK